MDAACRVLPNSLLGRSQVFLLNLREFNRIEIDRFDSCEMIIFTLFSAEFNVNHQKWC